MISYQNFKEQLSLLGLDINNIANDVFTNDSDNTPLENFKKCFDSLYEYRNIFAHQSSRKHENAEIIEIKKDDLVNYINTINKIVDCIIKQIQEK